MIELCPEEIPLKDLYKLMIGTIVPRPIAFVSTISAAGAPNLAPFSFFNGVCPKPFTISFCPTVRTSDGKKKDTQRNIEETGEFVVHVVTEAIAKQMSDTSGEYPPEVDEFDIGGFTPVPSVKVKPFRVKESPIQLECKLNQIVTIGEEPGAGCIVIGTVVHMHVADEVYDDGKIILEHLKPVARLAGLSYAKVTETFEIERPVLKV